MHTTVNLKTDYFYKKGCILFSIFLSLLHIAPKRTFKRMSWWFAFIKGHKTSWKDHYQLICGQLSTQRQSIFHNKQAEVFNTFLLAKLDQYLGGFDRKQYPTGNIKDIWMLQSYVRSKKICVYNKYFKKAFGAWKLLGRGGLNPFPINLPSLPYIIRSCQLWINQLADVHKQCVETILLDDWHFKVKKQASGLDFLLEVLTFRSCFLHSFSSHSVFRKSAAWFFHWPNIDRKWIR